MEFETLKELLINKKAVLIDVREDDEWQQGHVIGAIHIPLSRMVNFHLFDAIPKDKSLYIYCATGKRAILAQTLLKPYVQHIEALHFGFLDLKNHGLASEP